MCNAVVSQTARLKNLRYKTFVVRVMGLNWMLGCLDQCFNLLRESASYKHFWQLPFELTTYYIIKNSKISAPFLLSF